MEVVLASGMWELHDGQSPMIGADNLRGKPYNDEFAVAPEGHLRLGKAYDIFADDFEMQIPYSTMLSLQELLVTTVDTEATETGTEDVDGDDDTDV
ncbi:MAG: hypothetical protein CMB80_33290 [Flammeovirgaceae bacterium]|nr:hypothetical protein [Flammeovirgaceae bacterium]